MTDREDRVVRLAAAGAWLAEVRRRAGLTQQELGDAIGTTDQSISNYERGVAAVPDDAAVRIANALGRGVIETRRGLHLWVPEDATDDTATTLDTLAAIRRDPHLIPEARKHLINQYALLRRLGSPTSTTDAADELLDLPHAARKRPPRRPRA